MHKTVDFTLQESAEENFCQIYHVTSRREKLNFFFLSLFWWERRPTPLSMPWGEEVHALPLKCHPPTTTPPPPSLFLLLSSSSQPLLEPQYSRGQTNFRKILHNPSSGTYFPLHAINSTNIYNNMITDTLAKSWGESGAY